MIGAPVHVTWRPRPDPLPPIAAVGLGAVAADLARRLLTLADPWRLEALAGPDLLLVHAPDPTSADLLPWLDGLVWLARDPAAPRLLLPTRLAPSAPMALVERAVSLRFGPEGAPWALLPDATRVIPCAGLRPIAAPALERWLSERGTA